MVAMLQYITGVAPSKLNFGEVLQPMCTQRLLSLHYIHVRLLVTAAVNTAARSLHIERWAFEAAGEAALSTVWTPRPLAGLKV